MNNLLKKSTTLLNLFNNFKCSKLCWHSYATAGSAPTTSKLAEEQEDHMQSVLFDWYDEENGTYKALHSMNRVRVPWVADHLAPKRNGSEKYPLQGIRILDVGCGGGILSIALARLGAIVTGLDKDPTAVAVAQHVSQKILSPDLRQNVNFENLPVEMFDYDCEFDALTASEVVEHVENVSTFVSACVKLVKPKGRLFFTTINRTPLSQLFAINLAEDIFYLLPKGLHTHDKFVTPTELRSALLDGGCQVGPTFGLLYNPLSNQWKWSTFSEVNYALTGIKN